MRDRNIDDRGTLLLAAVLLASLSAAYAHPSIEVRIDDVTSRIEAAPADARLYLERGELYRTHRAWDAALDDYRTSRTLDPELAIVDFCLGRMKLEAGEPAEAAVALDRFLAKSPGHARGHELRARARAELGRYVDASRDYSTAIRLYLGGDGRPSPDAYIGHARALRAEGVDRLERSLTTLENGLAILGEPVTLHLEAIEVELALGRTDAALARIDRLTARSPRDEVWLLRRADVLERAGRLDEARRAYRRVLAAIAGLPEGRRAAGGVKRMEREARDGVSRLAR